MVYLIVQIESDRKSESVEEKIKNLNTDYYKADENVFFVYYANTTQKLSEKIGFGDDLDLGFGIVVPVTNYYGYALADMWEWVRKYETR